jgi:uncharacterized protein YqgC (DUF456 family)
MQSTLSVLISIVVFIAVTKKLYDSDEYDNIKDAAFIGFFVGVFTLLMLAILTTMALGIICPEYTIMRDVLSSLSPN